MNSPEIKLSVRLMTYNHEHFIKDAMDGIFMQETSFNFEVVVGDDFSTDRTLDIVRNYRSTDRIKLEILDRPEGGEYSKKRQALGRLYNFQNIVENCAGKYLAMLDGDDYWTDPKKLQKQVDFLEKNLEYALCGHGMSQLVGGVIKKEKGMSDQSRSVGDILALNDINLSSTVYRRDSAFEFPAWFVDLPFGDLPFHVLNTGDKKIMRMGSVMGVYRIHGSNVHFLLSSKERATKGLRMLEILKDHFPEYSAEVKQALKKRNYTIHRYSFLQSLKALKPLTSLKLLLTLIALRLQIFNRN